MEGRAAFAPGQLANNTAVGGADIPFNERCQTCMHRRSSILRIFHFLLVLFIFFCFGKDLNHRKRYHEPSQKLSAKL